MRASRRAGTSVTTEQELDLPSTTAAFYRGFLHTFSCATTYALAGTFLGTGALAHDLGFSLLWTILLNIIVWAGPAQLVLMTMLATGAAWPQIAVAVALSGVRLFPMAVALLPQMREKDTPRWHLLLAAHFTAITFMTESIRVFPRVARHRRIAFCNGYGVGIGSFTTITMIIGYQLAVGLPPTLAVGLLFLAPYSFLLSAAAGCRDFSDWLALIVGGATVPLVAMLDTGLEVLICGLGGGTLAYIVHRARRVR